MGAGFVSATTAAAPKINGVEDTNAISINVKKIAVSECNLRYCFIRLEILMTALTNLDAQSP